MNNTAKTGIFLGIAALVGYGLLRKTAALGTLNFFPEKFRSLKFSGLTPIATIGIGVQNTSNQSFTLNSLAGNAYSNDSYIGNVSSFQPVVIAPNSKATIVVEVRLQINGVVSELIQAFQNKHFSMDLKLNMHANIDTLQVPINLDYKVGL